jgi:predicted ABC-type transport system involved in lysophospholipase L1 biosynthesis ATPase subunit
MSDALVTVESLTKNYQALRPLRIQSLTLERAGLVSITGLDAQAAEMLVGLLTGAVLPDEGDIHLFGRSTRQVTDSEAWLEMLDDVGIVTDRAVLIAQFSVEQNLAIPFTLSVEPVPEDVRPQVVSLAGEVGLSASDLSTPVGTASPSVVARVRLARALALNPIVLIAEHPTASLPRDAVKPFATAIARVARERQLSVLAITADEAFASALGGQVLTHEPATGALRTRSGWRKIFG